MSRPFIDDGSLRDLPWASVFDPATNARALSAIQAEGFRAASQIVDRFARAARPNGDEAPASPISATQASPPDLEQLTRAWWSMAGQFLLGAASGNRARDAELDLAGGDGQQSVALESSMPGRATAVVWLHNRTGSDFGQVRVRCSELLGHHGSAIPSCEVRLQPEVMPMPPRCSRGIAVEVDVGRGVRPDVYRGNLLVERNSSLWLPVVLTIRAPGP